MKTNRLNNVKLWSLNLRKHSIHPDRNFDDDRVLSRKSWMRIHFFGGNRLDPDLHHRHTHPLCRRNTRINGLCHCCLKQSLVQLADRNTKDSMVRFPLFISLNRQFVECVNRHDFAKYKTLKIGENRPKLDYSTEN